MVVDLYLYATLSFTLYFYLLFVVFLHSIFMFVAFQAPNVVYVYFIVYYVCLFCCVLCMIVLLCVVYFFVCCLSSTKYCVCLFHCVLCMFVLLCFVYDCFVVCFVASCPYYFLLSSMCPHYHV